jgi:hypothetical protein
VERPNESEPTRAARVTAIPNFFFIVYYLSDREILCELRGVCPRLPDFLARSSPGAPHRGGGLLIDEPGLEIDALDRAKE